MSSTLLACDVLVVGAGPAGLAAAAAARENGADVICLDLFNRAGGQYHMQPAAVASPFNATSQVAQGRTATTRCRELGVQILLETEIFWAEPGFTIFARQGDGAVTIKAQTVVAATGAMERPIPFNGWTLPGVMTAGAAQRLIKANGVSPGENVVLAGTGPFLFAVANTFAKAGLGLRAYIERQKPTSAFVTPFGSHPSRAIEAIGLLRGLIRTGAARHTGHVVIEAMGENRVEAVRVAPCSADGRPDQARAFVIDGIDTLCIGYGFQPVIDFTSLLKASHLFDTRLGGWYCAVDPQTQATDIPSLFAAGEATGIGGYLPARLSGELAGSEAARAAGTTTHAANTSKLRTQLSKARDFAAKLADLFPFPDDLVNELSANEVVCRCEDVSRAAISKAIAEGADDVFAVKMWTRAGMGPCQGRICGTALAHLVASDTGGTVAAAGYNKPHMPLRPVSLSTADAALELATAETLLNEGQNS